MKKDTLIAAGVSAIIAGSFCSWLGIKMSPPLPTEKQSTVTIEMPEAATTPHSELAVPAQEAAESGIFKPTSLPVAQYAFVLGESSLKQSDGEPQEQQAIPSSAEDEEASPDIEFSCRALQPDGKWIKAPAPVNQEKPLSAAGLKCQIRKVSQEPAAVDLLKNGAVRFHSEMGPGSREVTVPPV